MTNQPAAPVSDVVGANVRELRRRRRLTAAEFADVCAQAGHPELTEQTIYNIESGRRVQGRRRRTVSVEELLAFAEVLQVEISTLLWPAHPPLKPNTLVFDSAEDRAHFVETVNKLLLQAHGAIPMQPRTPPPYSLGPAGKEE